MCRGGVGEVLGMCVGGVGEVCLGVSGRCFRGCRGVSGKCVGDGMMLKSVRMARGQQLVPLYYPDTLVNPDTCLGKRHCTRGGDFYKSREWFRSLRSLNHNEI